VVSKLVEVSGSLLILAIILIESSTISPIDSYDLEVFRAEMEIP